MRAAKIHPKMSISFTSSNFGRNFLEHTGPGPPGGIMEKVPAKILVKERYWWHYVRAGEIHLNMLVLFTSYNFGRNFLDITGRGYSGKSSGQNWS